MSERSERYWFQWPEFWLLVGFSISDIALTAVLIGSYGHVEANPVARFFIYGWGLKGMIWFKTGMLGLIVGAVHLVQPHRPLAARSLIRFAAITVAIVVGWSLYLLISAASVQ